MNNLVMKKYGKILTGREFGIETFENISKELKGEVSLDFSGVISIGSGFADEVIIPIAWKQGGIIKIYNASNSVKSCINMVAADGRIKVEYK